VTVEAVSFPSGALTLHGRYQPGSADRGVVVTHPHPLYGGDMDNPVVETLAAAYHRAGWATLRFNFRGVGRSSGRFDDGRGETSDLAAAAAWLAGQGIARISLAGYSFGAWVMAHLTDPPAAVDHMVMISPPVAFMDFSAVGSLPTLALATTGRMDAYAPPDLVKSHLARWNPACRYHELPLADHFYWGQFDELDAVVKHFLSGR
jgi:alpha/beta superfamily hydrolase